MLRPRVATVPAQFAPPPAGPEIALAPRSNRLAGKPAGVSAARFAPTAAALPAAVDQLTGIRLSTYAMSNSGLARYRIGIESVDAATCACCADNSRVSSQKADSGSSKRAQRANCWA